MTENKILNRQTTVLKIENRKLKTEQRGHNQKLVYCLLGAVKLFSCYYKTRFTTLTLRVNQANYSFKRINFMALNKIVKKDKRQHMLVKITWPDKSYN